MRAKVVRGAHAQTERTLVGAKEADGGGVRAHVRDEEQNSVD